MARKARTETSFAGRQPSPADSTVALLRQVVRDLFDPYRPELHYMRGPGPKWHAKHAPAARDVSVGNSGLRQATV
jgi:hypothetical protein